MPKVGRRSKTYKKSTRRRRTKRTAMTLYKPMHSFGPKQYAHIRESIEWQNIQSNSIYNNCFVLAEFERANRLATNFKYYRAQRVTWTYEPMYNTYPTSVNAGAPGIPYLYLTMNRSQDSQLQGLTSPSNLLAQGAKPKKLAKVITVSYTPNWNSPGLIGQNVSNGNVINVTQCGAKVEYGWIPAPNVATPFSSNRAQGIIPQMNLPNFNISGDSISGPGGIGNNAATLVTNGVTYMGHYIFIEQLNRPSNTLCKVTCTVDWVFKDPNYVLATPNSDLL